MPIINRIGQHHEHLVIIVLGFLFALCEFHISKGTYPIDLAFTMTKGEIIPTHFDTFWSLVTNNKLWVTSHKVPCLTHLNCVEQPSGQTNCYFGKHPLFFI
jgi:hypothetical protein